MSQFVTTLHSGFLDLSLRHVERNISRFVFILKLKIFWITNFDVTIAYQLSSTAMSRPSRQHESAILIYGWGARASRKTPAWLLSTMSRMTKNAQKIHSRNPVLLSDLLGNFWTSKSQCFTFLSFVPALPEDTAGVAEGLKWKGEIKYILLLILTEY